MEKQFNFSSDYCPTKKECFDILDDYGTPDHVKLHCNAVSETGRAIAVALNEKGLHLNTNLIASAGYLHDIARVHKNHEEVGGAYLKSIGLFDVGNLVSQHKIHKVKGAIENLQEVDILCIADRVVLQSHFVGPEKRMEYIKKKALKKFGKENEHILDRVIADFISFIEALENYLGDRIYNLVPNDIRV